MGWPPALPCFPCPIHAPPSSFCKTCESWSPQSPFKPTAARASPPLPCRPSPQGQQHHAHPGTAVQGSELLDSLGQPLCSEQSSKGSESLVRAESLSFLCNPSQVIGMLQRMLQGSPDAAGTLLHRHRPALGSCCVWKRLQAGEGTHTLPSSGAPSSSAGSFFWSSPSKATGVLQITSSNLIATGRGKT